MNTNILLSEDTYEKLPMNFPLGTTSQGSQQFINQSPGTKLGFTINMKEFRII